MKTLFKHQKSTFKRIFKKYKLLLRSIAVSLVLALLFTSLPMDGIIALAEQAIEESKLITVVEELEEYRTEFSKTYLKSDGTLEAVVSSNPIHFNEDGEWVEIDSTLETAENEKGEEILQNKKGSFNVELPAELQNGSEIAIEKGKNKISIKLLEAKKFKAKKNNEKKEKSEKLTKAQRKRMTAGELFEVDNNQSSAVEYTSAYNDTNIRYDVTPNEVKESIVLTKAPNKKATYSYEITADGLTAILNEDNSIDFFEGSKTDGAEPVFSMPAPHMFDSNDEYSYDIVTTLENKKGKYILTYKPSYEWLKSKDRAYPITIDPTVTINSGIQDSYTFSGEGYGDSYTGYEQQLKVGTTAWIAPNDYWQTYLKFTDLPQIPYEDYRIDSAYLMLTPKATTGGWQEMELGVYELTEDWKNHQTGKVAERITFNNAPADVGYSTATATVSRGGADNGVGVGFEIAHLMEKWYENPEENFGIKLAAHLEASQWNDNLVFHSSRSTTGTAPYLSLTYTEYVPVTGIEIINKPTDNKWAVGCYMPTFELNATVYPENATNKEVIWESSNPEVGDIDGLNVAFFAPNSIGFTTITAKSADNNEIIDSFDLEVYNIPIETLTITNRPENDTLETGTSHQLSIEAGPDNASDKYYVESDNGAINWSSSDNDIVSVDRYSGGITANSRGTATITATYGNIVDSITLTVKDPLCDEIELLYIKDTAVLFEHEQYSFSAEAKYQNSYVNAHLSYSSNNTDVISFLEDGIMVANSTGNATVTVSVTDYPEVFKNIAVTVVPIQSAEIVNLPENNSLGIYENHRLDLEITAQDYAGIENDPCHGGRFAEFFDWSSSNPDIATVDAEGNIYPNSAGTTIISARRPNGGAILDSFILTVIPPDYTYEFNRPTSDFLIVGETHQLITNANEYIVDIEDPTILSADDNGKITALDSGTTKIYIGTTAFDGVELYEYTVTVINPVNWKYNNGYLINYGKTYTITNNQDVNLSLSSEGTGNVIINSNNSITATALGNVTIVASYRDVVLTSITLCIFEKIEIIGKPTNNTIYAKQVYEGLSTINLPSELPCGADWWSSDESIAKVEYDDFRCRTTLTGVNEGSVWIGVESLDPVNPATDGFWLYVQKISVESFEIVNHSDYPELSDHIAYIGDRGVLKAQITPDHEYVYYNEIEWTSNNGDGEGIEFLPRSKNEKLLRFKKAGNYEISATIDGMPSTNKYTITVKQPKATITNKPQSNAIYKGGTHQLSCIKEPEEATVTWTSKNTSIATVDSNGKITAKASGYVVITVKTTYRNRTYTTDSFTLNVRNQWIWVDGYNSTTLIVGDVVNLKADVGANAGNDRTVAWKSSKESIASVNSNGKVTANAPGTVTITAYLVNHPDISWPVVFEVSFSSSSPEIKYGEVISSHLSAGEVEYYKFVPAKSGKYFISLFNTQAVVCDLFYGDTLIVTNNVENAFHSISCDLIANEKYYLRIKTVETNISRDYNLIINGWPYYVEPNIFLRDEWDADSPNSSDIENRDATQTKRIIFHHSAKKFDSTNIADCKEEIKRIQLKHFDRGFADIGYHYIIDPFGRIWEGRNIQYKGSHTTGYNNDIGILVLGDFESRALNWWSPNELNNNQKNAMIELSKRLCFKHSLDFIETGKEIAPISMHYILNDTECPGDNMVSWINESLQPTIIDWHSIEEF